MVGLPGKQVAVDVMVRKFHGSTPTNETLTAKHAGIVRTARTEEMQVHKGNNKIIPHPNI